MYNVTQEVINIATNLSIDPELLNNAFRISGKKTKRETVDLALQEFITKREIAGVIDLFGKIEYDKDYDYKKDR